MSRSHAIQALLFYIPLTEEKYIHVECPTGGPCEVRILTGYTLMKERAHGNPRRPGKVLYLPHLWVSKGKKAQNAANFVYQRRLVETCLGLRAEFASWVR